MHDLIVSPSISSTRRSTPCVLGCWGPMLTVIVSVRMSGIGRRPRILLRARRVRGALCVWSSACQPVLYDVRAEFLLRDLQRLARARRQLDLHGIILAQ